MPSYGFTGTQRGMTPSQKHIVRELLIGCSEFHHGDCIGADADAHDIAEVYGLKIVIHPPITAAKRAWKKGTEIRSPKPYLDRNKDIVRETSALIATPGEDTEKLRSGTWSTVRFAQKLGRPIIIILPNGSVRSFNRKEAQS